MGTCVLRSFELIMGHSSSHPRLNTTAIFFSSASIMCQVTSFFCGCADLRKGALIIGIIKLVSSLIQLAWAGVLLLYALGVGAFVASGGGSGGGFDFDSSDFGNANANLNFKSSGSDEERISAKTAVAATFVTVLVILGLLLVSLIANIIINALLIHAARNSKPGYTLPWLIINMIGIVFGVLSLIFSRSWFSLVDVPLTIYFWIVIKSYRTQLQDGTLATV